MVPERGCPASPGKRDRTGKFTQNLRNRSRKRKEMRRDGYFGPASDLSRSSHETKYVFYLKPYGLKISNLQNFIFCALLEK